jgi:hypothetical protein
MDVAVEGHELATSGLASTLAGVSIGVVAIVSVAVVCLTFIILPRRERIAGDGQEQSFSAVVAPVLAGFTLAAITALATSGEPAQPWRDLVLSYMIMATGFFLASFQLSVGDLYRSHRVKWATGRASLTFTGIVLLAASLIVLVAAVAAHWWVTVALVVLGLGGLIPMLLQLWHYLHRPQGPASKGRSPASLSRQQFLAAMKGTRPPRRRTAVARHPDHPWTDPR